MESTLFSNPTVNSETLPSIEKLTFEAISPKHRKANLVINFTVTTFIFLALQAICYQTWLSITDVNIEIIKLISYLTIGFGCFVTGFTAVSDKYKAFCIREHDISYRSGLIFRNTVTQPIGRVQHAELKQGPIDRKLGLAKLQLYSAGGAMHTFEIPGLPYQLGESMRQRVINQKVGT